MYDVLIIGAGVVGACIARELSKYKMNIIIVDKENDVSLGASKANSGVVHAGYDAHYESLKAKFNVRGSRIFEAYAKKLGVPYKKVGSLVCASSDEELETLKSLLKNGQRLGLDDLRIVDREELVKMEPNISDHIIGALYAPSAAITEPWELAIACIENAMDNLAELKLNFKVENIVKRDGYFQVISEKEVIKSKFIINAAGVYADKIYKMLNKDVNFSIIPRRGEYFLLDKATDGYVKHIVFPCPSDLGKGVLVLPTVNGNILVGPDSENLGEKQREDTQTVSERLMFIKKSASKLIKDIPFNENITNFSGIRAQPSNDDFLIGESQIEGFFNAAGIKSPGLSSAPAIGEYMRDIILDKISESGSNLLRLEVKDNYIEGRKAPVKIRDLEEEELAKYISENPLYAKIICRCEMISEGEIIDSIHRNCGATSVNGIKRRVRPGAGRCQGGFCSPRVVEILSRELDIKMEEVLYEGKDSKILKGKTKS